MRPRPWHIALLTLAASFFAAPDAAAQPRTARTIRVDSAAIGSPATVAVLLPVDYESSSAARYPVLYLLHGGTQNHTAFPARSWFNKTAAQHRMIVVMPYLQPALFTARGTAPGPYEEFLGRELPAYIDATYRTVPDKRGRAIAGISMGGFGATMMGLKRPDMFAAVGAVSAALTTGGRMREAMSLIAALPPEVVPYFFVGCGLQDPVLAGSRELVAALLERKIAAELHEVPGAHDWSVWDSEIRAFFDVLATRGFQSR